VCRATSYGMHRRTRGVTAALRAVPAAHADGDPASDCLIGQRVFFPYDSKILVTQQIQFAQLVREANKAGFTIRAALIASSYDMGSVTSLYLKPRAYARFLGQELSFVYRQRLLVVMRNGFGFNWPHRFLDGRVPNAREDPHRSRPHRAPRRGADCSEAPCRR
jgi:hypothetical protein